MQSKHLKPIATNLIFDDFICQQINILSSDRTPDFWIEHLQLLPHPEGGYYRETYRSRDEFSPKDMSRLNGYRSASTAIYFLLTSEDRSLFHRIKSDEVWHFHYGGPLNIYVLTERGLAVLKLGADPTAGESLQVVVPANHWFGAITADQKSYTLTSCTVSPGFDFLDFELASKNELLAEYPAEADIINRLTNA